MATSDLLVGPYRLLHHYTDSDLITVRILIGTGSGHDPVDKYGIAHYIEHMFFKGTEDKTYKEINKTISKIGEANAYTYESRTVYYINCLAEDFEKATDILFEMLSKPRFDKEEFDKEKNVILEEVQTYLDSPQEYFWDQLKSKIFGTKSHVVAGTKESVQGITIEDIIKFRKDCYKQITFIIVGKIDLRRAISKIEKLNKRDVTETINYLDDQIILKDFQLNHASKQAALAVVTKGIPGYEAPENGIVSVLQNAMGEGMHSLMFDRVREELGLCYSIGTYIQCYSHVGAMVTVCWLDAGNIEQAKSEIVKILEKIKQEGVSEELIEIAKKNYIITLIQNTQTSSSYAANVLDLYYSQGCKITDYEKERKQIIGVTNKDLMDFANKYFDKICFVTMTEGANQ